MEHIVQRLIQHELGVNLEQAHCLPLMSTQLVDGLYTQLRRALSYLSTPSLRPALQPVFKHNHG